jgi:hypothetical protein
MAGGQQSSGRCIVRQSGGFSKPRPEFSGRRERIDQQFLAGEEIELDDLVAIGGEGEFQVQDLGVVFRLLQPLTRRLLIRLGLDDRDREVAGEPQQVIGPFLRLSADLVARQDNPAIGERFLLADRLVGPAGRVDLRRDELATGIGFALRHTAILFGRWWQRPWTAASSVRPV